MTVYIVTGDDGGAWWIEGVFTTREGAERFVADWSARNPERARHYPLTIDEWEADRPFAPPATGGT